MIRFQNYNPRKEGRHISYIFYFIHPLQETLSSESSHTNSSTSVIQDMFATDVEIESVCRCGKHISRVTSEMNFPMIYPSSPSPLQTVSFAVLVQQSLCRKQQIHMWCDECTRYRPAVSAMYIYTSFCYLSFCFFLQKEKRRITNLPCILCLTCQIDSEEAHRFWAAHRQSQPSLIPNKLLKCYISQ